MDGGREIERHVFMKIITVRGANSEIDGRSLSEYVLFQQFVFYNIYNQGSLGIARILR